MKSLLPILLFFTFGVLQAQLWQDNYKDAVSVAQEVNKPIVLVFSGSDWCAPCIRLKRNILESEDFKTYADSHYVLYNADFPRKKKNQLPEAKLNSNKSLAEQFNPKGHFPLIVVLNEQQTVLGKTGFNRKTTPKEYIALLNSFVR